MIEVRIHGRGGQGAVTTAELLAYAAFLGGKHAQAFPSFGVERSGSPVESYCRIDDKPIRLHQQVYEPDYLLVLDDSLFSVVDVCKGLRTPGGSADDSLYSEKNVCEQLGFAGAVIIATKKPATDFQKFVRGKVFVVDAYGIAEKIIGKPLVNTALLGAFAKVTGIVTLDNLEKAFYSRFSSDVAKKNAEAARACFEQVTR